MPILKKIMDFVTGWMNPSLENLHAEHVDTKDQLNLLEKQVQSEPEKEIIAHCRMKLVELEKAIDGRKIVAAWRMLHRLQEDMLLAMRPGHLAAEGYRLLQTLQLSSLSGSVKEDWTARIKAVLERLENNAPDGPDRARAMLRTVSNIINDFTDDQFWDIWAKRWMSFLYTCALIVLLIVLYARVQTFYISDAVSPGAVLTISMVMLLGAIGGYASGIWGNSQEYFAKGYFWINTFYYALVRPVAGVLGAIIMFWMLQGQSYIRITPHLPATQLGNENYIRLVNCSKRTTDDIRCPNVGNPAGAVIEAAVVSGPEPAKSEAGQPSLITFNAPEGMALFPYLLLLLIAGFSGDRLLKNVNDKVMTKLFVEAEKTKDAAKGA